MGRFSAFLMALWFTFAAIAPTTGQVSPFEDVEWEADGLPRVMVAGEWWEPVAIDGVDYAELLAFAREHYETEAKVQKRMDENLLEVLELFGAPAPGPTVRLTLRPVGGGPEVVHPSVRMTRENRQRLRAKRSAPGDAALYLLDFAPKTMARSEAAELLDGLGELLALKHSYSVARGVEIGRATEEAKEGLAGDPVDTALLVREMERVIALSGDAHATIGGQFGALPRLAPPAGGLPFVVTPLELRAGGRVVAVKESGRGLVDARYPYLVAIDGVEIERWLEVAAEGLGGSAQARRAGACKELSRMGWIRERLGLAAEPTANITLESGDGQHREKRVAAQFVGPRGYRKPGGRPSIAFGAEIAYVPIERMYDPEGREGKEGYRAVERALRAASHARGLIIDVRGNSGGTRDVLHLVASHLMARDAEPVVYSAARALVWPGRDAAKVSGQLERRFLFPSKSERWTEAERRAIGRFLAGFRPEVDLPDDRFGPLHVSVLSPGGGGELAGKPVVVLMDEDCASACDVFLAAMKELPGVTLVGRPSHGASGMAEPHLLAGKVELWLSSMVSFMPDGRVFDWHGIEPDVPVELTPHDFTRAGADTALIAAAEMLGKRTASPRRE